MKASTIYVIIIVAIAVLFIAAAGLYVKIAEIQPEVSQLREAADPIAEDILVALDSGDYMLFMEHMDDTMAEIHNESVFNELSSWVITTIGNYTSMDYWKADNAQGFLQVYYKADYTGEPAGVVVLVVLTGTGEDAEVSGLWFDSPKIRAETE